MHRKLTALIISISTLTSAHAATELYGSLQLGMTRLDKQGLAIEDYGSYIGLRGSESLGEDTQLIFNLRWAFNAADGGENGEGFENEIAMIGLETSAGTFAIGRMENPFYDVVKADSVSDDFNALGLSASAAAAGDILLGNA